MKNVNQLMKQAQQMQVKIQALQKELSEREIEASSGGGAVKVVVNGKQELVSISIERECVDPSDVDTLEEMILLAVNQGIKESNDMVSKAMNKVTGGMNIPGLF